MPILSQILSGYVLDAFLGPWVLLIKSLGLALAVASSCGLEPSPSAITGMPPLPRQDDALVKNLPEDAKVAYLEHILPAGDKLDKFSLLWAQRRLLATGGFGNGGDGLYGFRR